MRFVPLATALAIVLLPAGAAAPAEALSLTGPSALALDGPTRVPLLVGLTLDDVVCARAVDVPVRLTARTDGARAALASQEVVFRVSPESTLARAWTGEARTHAIVEATKATGVVEIVARYQLPAECRSTGGPTTGEARHLLDVSRAPAAASPLATIGLTEKDVEPSSRAGLQLAIAGTAVAGLAVAVKRIRSSRDP